MIVPESATPRVMPASRPTEASEAGLPDTAELVIGGLMVPWAMPKSR
jgi:hypothetical protein